MRTALITLCLLLVVSALPGRAVDMGDKEPAVLLINSYAPDYSWTVTHNAAILSELRGTAEVDIFYMDTKRLPEEQHPGQAEKAWRHYKQTNPDMVILADDTALKYLGQRLFNDGKPTVYLGINGNPRDYLSHPHLMTGVLERPLFRRTVRLINSLLPERPRRGLILFDDSPTSRALASEIFHGRNRTEMAGVAITFLRTNVASIWRDAFASAKEKGYDFVAVGTHQTLRDENGDHYPQGAALAWASANTTVPLFGFWEMDVGKGKTIGGQVLSGQEHGSFAGDLARRVLCGETPGEAPPIHDRRGLLVFSRYELARWGLSLPPDLPAGVHLMD